MTRITRFLFYWLPPVGWMAAIFALSAGPLPELPRTFDWSDKIAHAGAYGLLGALLGRALGQAGGRWEQKNPGWTMGIGMLYGASDEFHQALVPGRSSDVTDWLADVAGLAVVVGLRWWMTVQRRMVE